ncbi:hypothetical protein BY996DRAFT_6417331 [Phakopsora pachyrhizi]|nr:hypothetical protein BY996DRAFT_6417331 [Phakopsora pachyrhizi]
MYTSSVLEWSTGLITQPRAVPVMYIKPQGTFPEVINRRRTSLAFDNSVGVILRTSALKSSKLASGTFLRLSGAYACTGWASGTSKSSSCCAAAAAAQVASYMKLWVLH